jgi:hypothetical protein
MWRKRKPRRDVVSSIISAAKQVFIETAKKAGEKVSEQLATFVAGLVVAPASAIVGVALGAGTGKFIEVLLKAVDKTEQKLDWLVSNPFNTGIGEIQHAMPFEDGVKQTRRNSSRRTLALSIGRRSENQR